MPTALVIRAPGTNCDTEMVRAFSLAGAHRTDLVHLDRLIADPSAIEQYDLIGFPGGFSYGDDVASGRVFAMRLRERLYAPLAAAVDRGACIIGACNGFQVLVQVGLLPGPVGRASSLPSSASLKPVGQASSPPSSLPPLTVALTDNIGNRFIDRWLRVEAVETSVCIWTTGIAERWPSPCHRLPAGDGSDAATTAKPSHRLEAGPTDARPTNPAMTLPIAHGEGRFVTDSSATLEAIESGGQVALRYADNDNGSQNRIAGICDPTGRVFGLMPHPERYLAWHHHPYATALPEEFKRGDTPGLAMFKNAVEAVSHAGAR